MSSWEVDGQRVEVRATQRGAVVIEVDNDRAHEGATLRLSREHAERLVADIRAALDEPERAR